MDSKVELTKNFTPKKKQPNIQTTRQYWTYDLLQIKWLDWLVKRRSFQFWISLPLVGIFLFIIYAGLFGTQFVGKNVSTILTWTIWWTGIMFFIVFVGKAWCLMCPWAAIADWVQKGTLWKKVNSTLGLEEKWPQKWRNIYIAMVLFIILTWLELGFGVTGNPMATAYLAILMLLITLIPAVIFERKSFCRYGCLVGRISGLYALFSSIEIRSRDKQTCKGCQTKDCMNGNERGYGCPTFEYPGEMELNTYCIMCTECIKTCPSNNMTINLRPWGVDLLKSIRSRTDEAYLSLIMLSLSYFHGFTMIPSWFAVMEWGQVKLNLGYTWLFSLSMLVLMALPVMIYFIFAYLVKLSTNHITSFKDIFVNFAYPFLPIALFYHLSHNTMHFFSEGQKVIPVISDPLGRGWDLFGTANWMPSPLFTPLSLQIIQTTLVFVGTGYALHTAYKAAQKIFPAVQDMKKGLAPMVLLILVYTGLSLWMSFQPMVMRTTTVFG